jgi:hypothetical protein
MSTQSNNPGPTAGAAAQPPVTPPAQPAPQPASGGSPAPVPKKLSGTWLQAEDPQILFSWNLEQEKDQVPPSASSDPGSGTPSYKARVRIYQQIFDTEFPAPPRRGPVVPFSVTDPSVGTAPYLQGSFVLWQNPLSLEVVNLRFPGFQSQTLTLYPDPSTGPGPGTEGGDTAASPSGSSPSTTAGEVTED